MAAFEQTLFEDFTINGTWWFPDKPNEPKHGYLRYSPGERLQLYIIDPYRNYRNSLEEQGSFKSHTIYGFTPELDEYFITLFDCLLISDKTKIFADNIPAVSIYEPKTCVIGKHVPAVKHLKTRTLRLRFRHLEEFIFSPKAKEVLANKGYYQRSFKAKHLNGMLEFILAKSSTQELFKETSKVEGHLRVSLNKCIGFEKSFSLLRDIQSLLTVLVGNPLDIQQYWIEDKDGDVIKIFYNFGFDENDKKIDFHHMNITLWNIEDVAEQIFSRWFEYLPVLRPLISILYGVEYKSHKLTEFIMIALTQALESLHRNTIAGRYIDSHEFESYRNQVMMIPFPGCEDFKKSFANRVKYGNEFSQRKRFYDLLAKLPKPFMDKIQLTKKDIDRIVETRNYYIHFDRASRKSKLPHIEIFYANFKLMLLMKLLIYRTIGIPANVMTKALKTSKEYRIIRQRRV